MTSAVSILALALALLGHWSFFLWLGNHVHAVGWRRSVTKLFTKPINWCLSLGTLAFCFWLWNNGALVRGEPWWPALPLWLRVYGMFALGVAILFFPRWLWRQLTWQPPVQLRSNHTTTVDLEEELAGQLQPAGLGHIYLRIPGNESLRLAVHEKRLEVPRLPPALDGLAIAHLSDLHFTGRIGKSYFQEVVRRTNQLGADFVAITGDVVDNSSCIDWIHDTLGKLRAPYGVYFVLGNHDLRVDHRRLRQQLMAAGAVDLSGRWLIREVRGQRIVLAGNELPWIGPAPDMQSCDAAADCLRILLSHTPDQIQWARDHKFDLMLAGHTHGGQIRFPMIGPILAPSHYGVRYASGTFYRAPTLMHVSRGISGLQPIRFNCPPELAKLVLTVSPASDSTD